jgi:hypothetical protein
MAINEQWKLHQITTVLNENMPNAMPIAELIVASNRLHPLRLQSDKPTVQR